MTQIMQNYQAYDLDKVMHLTRDQCSVLIWGINERGRREKPGGMGRSR